MTLKFLFNINIYYNKIILSEIFILQSQKYMAYSTISRLFLFFSKEVIIYLGVLTFFLLVFLVYSKEIHYNINVINNYIFCIYLFRMKIKIRNKHS